MEKKIPVNDVLIVMAVLVMAGISVYNIILGL